MFTFFVAFSFFLLGLILGFIGAIMFIAFLKIAKFLDDDMTDEQPEEHELLPNPIIVPSQN